MGSKGKRYSPKFKFNVVLEALTSERTDAGVARAFEVHPATVSRWKKQFLEKGPEVFGGSEEIKEYEERIGQLERMLGQKEVEIALLRNFFPTVDPGREDRAGGRTPGRTRAQPVPPGAGRLKGTWHYRIRGGSKAAERRAEDERLKEPIVQIIARHPAYGYRRIQPELEELIGEAVNHKRLRRLLGE